MNLPRGEVCDLCAEDNLHWRAHEGRWRLFDEDGYLHQCHVDSVICKYCEERHLHWEDTPEGWRLFDRDDNQHECL